MKIKNKTLWIIALIIFIICVSEIIYIVYMQKNEKNMFSESVNINYVENIDIKINYSQPFTPNIEQNNDYSNVCLYVSGTYPSVLYLSSVTNNLEGYNIEQFLEENFENYDNYIYLADNENTKILKTNYFEENGSEKIYVYIILKNNIYYTFKFEPSYEISINEIVVLDEIIKNIEIDDSKRDVKEIDMDNIESEQGYYYSILNNEEKAIYDEIINTLKKGTAKDGISFTHTCKDLNEFYIYKKIGYYIQQDYDDYFSIVSWEDWDDYDEVKKKNIKIKYQIRRN